MPKEKVMVIGLGEVGRPLFELLRESVHFNVFGVDLDEGKMHEVGQDTLPSEVDVMHVCIPCSSLKKFADIVIDYVKKLKPNLVIINSTVPPGTTSNVYMQCGGCLVAHSPVRGVHKSLEYMKSELRRWTKYVGGINDKAGKAAKEHFQKLGLNIKVLKSCYETELAKLFETTYRAWMIACFQEMHRISKYFGADFDGVVDFLEDTHRVIFDRPIMFPSVIRGHCLIPNVELLLKRYDSEFLRLILESNERRKEEIKDKDIMNEIEKVQWRVKALEKDLLNKCRSIGEKSAETSP